MESYLANQTGLSNEEVTQRITEGQINKFEENIAKSTTAIIKENVFTLFNFLNVAIAICLALVGAYSNMVFLLIILVNCLIGIYQEIHARNMVAKLSLVTKQEVTVIRNSLQQIIESEQLVLDDVVIIAAGEQVSADMEVLAGQVEANEALLTGESDLIEKQRGSQLLSGSFLASGQCVARVTHVGQDNYANQITAQAKVHKPIQSELVASILTVSKFTSIIIVPLGIILLLEALFLRGDGPKQAVISSAAALLGMLPKGLVLLISIALATAVTKLAKERILVQEMYAVETLAHVDVLCLDKTGTITEGKMKVERIETFESTLASQVEAIIGGYLNKSTDNNITMQALRDYFAIRDEYQTDRTIDFSSDRKWGAVHFEEFGWIVLGAPERLVAQDQLPEQVKQAQEIGLRVLLLGKASGPIENYQLDEVELLALIEIDDPIRQNAKQTLDYLSKEGIEVKVISGDNPVTVANIARRAGLADHAAYVDLSEYQTAEELQAIVNQYSVFGRVSPQQKQILVKELKKQGHTVAMTGDGVNDVLALREADCSIAMAEGDSATRQIANLVLMDSDFSSLPQVLFEGRRVVNNVTKVASIFFIKTIYSFLLAILCAVTTVAFPFAPIQITLIDLAIEGYPSFFLSFEQNKQKIQGKFLPTVIKNALPNALLVLLNIVVVYLYGNRHGFSQLEQTTVMYYLLIAVSLLAVFKACLPLNRLRLFLIITASIGTYLAAYLFQSILMVGTLTANTWPFFLLLLMTTVLLRVMVELFQKRKSQ